MVVRVLRSRPVGEYFNEAFMRNTASFARLDLNMSKGFTTVLTLILCVGAAVVRAEPLDILINEILYDADSSNTGGEFIELFNRGDADVDLSGWVVTEAVNYTFPFGAVLGGGEYLVLARDAQAAATYYDIAVFGAYVGRLSNDGEAIVLQDNSLPRRIIDVVDYSDQEPWPIEAGGFGSSLELANRFLDNSFPTSWWIGDLYTPGAPNQPVLSGGGVGSNEIVISEIMYNPRREEERRDNRGFYMEQGDDEFGEYIEIYNRSTSMVDLSGWSFTEGLSFTFEEGTTLGSGDYLVVCSAPDILGQRFGIANVVGPFESGVLADSGERITLRNESGRIVDTVVYDDRHPWPVAADSFGYSIEVIDVDEDNSSADNWRVSLEDIPTVPVSVDSSWQFSSATGVATSGRLYFYTNGTGQWLIDEITVIAEATATVAHYRFEEGEGGQGAGADIHNALDGSRHGTLETGRFSTDAPGLPAGVENDYSVDFAGIGTGGAVRIHDQSFIFHTNGVPGDATLEWYMKTASQPHSSIFWTNRDDVDDNRRFNIHFNPDGTVAADFNPGNGNVGIGGVTKGVPFNQWTHVAMVRRFVNTDVYDWEWYVNGILRSTERSDTVMPGSATWSIGGRPGCCPYNGKVDEVRMTAAALGAEDFIHSAGIGAESADVTVIFSESFESGDANWSNVGNQSGTWTNENAHDGTASEKLTGSGTGSGGGNSFQRDIPGIVEGQVYTISFWSKWLSGNPGLTSRLSGGGVLQVHGLDVDVDTPIAGAVGRGTPGRVNSVNNTGVPPFVESLTHVIETPLSNEQQTILASVSGQRPITSVQAYISTGLSQTRSTLTMFDDGFHGDGTAGDGVYGVQVTAMPSRTLVHYSIRVVDDSGRETLFPYPDEPSSTQAYYHYNDGDVATNLTRYDLFIAQSDVNQLTGSPYREDYVDCSVVIDGIAYPQIETRLRGAGSRTSSKLQWKFRFNRHKLPGGDRTIDTMINIPYTQEMIFEIYDRSGIEANLESELIRLDREGEFWGVYIAFESPNSTWVRKHGHGDQTEVYKARTITPTHNSDLYKNQLLTDWDFWWSWNKKTRSLEKPDEIRELVDTLNFTAIDELLPWLDQNVDLDQWFQRWALYILMNVDDFAAHNYYLMLPEGNGGKWQQIAYDFDSGFTHGRVGSIRLLYGDGKNGDLANWQRGRLYEIVSENETLQRIYFFKVQDMLDDFYHSSTLFPVMDELFARAGADRTLDINRWGTMRRSTSEMKRVFASQRSRTGNSIDGENLPTLAFTVEPEPGEYQEEIWVLISSVGNSNGWSTRITTDGSDPRLSDTATLYLGSQWRISESTTLRVAGLRGSPAGGDWSRDFRFDFTISSSTAEVGPFRRGDCDSNGRIDGLQDALTLLFHNFVGNAAPSCMAACDVNTDGLTSGVGDAIDLLMYAYLNGPAPGQPFPFCGSSTTASDLDLGCLAPQTSCRQAE